MIGATAHGVILVVDDDASLRRSLDSLLRSRGFTVYCFTSVSELSAFSVPDSPSCLLLDVRLGGANGLEFQDDLAKKDTRIPIVFMTGYGDVSMSVRAMKAGAVDFLSKPFQEQELIDAVLHALEKDRSARHEKKQFDELHSRFNSLTSREQEVMLFAASGLMNKQIAGHIGTSEITVKIHRGNAMKKMRAKTFADMVRMVAALGKLNVDYTNV